MDTPEWLESVYSDSTAAFVSNPYPRKGEVVTFSLRVLKDNELTHVFLRAREYGIEGLHEMAATSEENGLAYYTVDVQIRDPYFNYQFYLVTGTGIYYYTQFRITDYIPAEDADFVLLADYEAPRWVKDTVFYQIFPDRFCNGRPELNVKPAEYSYQGYAATAEDWDTPAMEYEQGHNLDFRNGDLYGIIDRLDYLQDLGINGIYLNPIFLSPSIHKYDALDYFHIDPHLGGDEAFSRLIAEMHRRGMKLLLDISINHTSSAAKWFNKGAEFYPAAEGAYNSPSSPYRDFYFFGEGNGYASWFGVPTMPQLNYTSPRLRDIIYRGKDSVLKKWLSPPYGIDGWRFDVADCMARNEQADVHEEVLREIRAELKGLRSDTYLVAEEWADCSVDLQGDRWDATMNYFGCARPLREFAGAKDLYNERNQTLRKVDAQLTAPQLAKRICQFYARLPGAIQQQQFNLIDSHDVVRLHNTPDVGREALRAVLVMQFALPGSPSIYYGDEILLDGSDRSVDACRNPFNWRWEQSPDAVAMRDFYRRLIALRRKEKALREGSFRIVSAEGFVIAFSRFTRKEAFFIVCSLEAAGEAPRTVRLPLSHYGVSPASVTEDCLGSEVQSEVRNGTLEVAVPPQTCYLLKF